MAHYSDKAGENSSNVVEQDVVMDQRKRSFNECRGVSKGQDERQAENESES